MFYLLLSLIYIILFSLLICVVLFFFYHFLNKNYIFIADFIRCGCGDGFYLHYTRYSGQWKWHFLRLADLAEDNLSNLFVNVWVYNHLKEEESILLWKYKNEHYFSFLFIEGDSSMGTRIKLIVFFSFLFGMSQSCSLIYFLGKNRYQRFWVRVLQPT